MSGKCTPSQQAIFLVAERTVLTVQPDRSRLDTRASDGQPDAIPRLSIIYLSGPSPFSALYGTLARTAADIVGGNGFDCLSTRKASRTAQNKPWGSSGGATAWRLYAVCEMTTQMGNGGNARKYGGSTNLIFRRPASDPLQRTVAMMSKHIFRSVLPMCTECLPV